MPVLLVIVGEVVNNPALRGKATGMVAAGMSLGMGLCPFVAGTYFRSCLSVSALCSHLLSLLVSLPALTFRSQLYLHPRSPVRV
jgi:hypothetical protein